MISKIRGYFLRRSIIKIIRNDMKTLREDVYKNYHAKGMDVAKLHIKLYRAHVDASYDVEYLEHAEG